MSLHAPNDTCIRCDGPIRSDLHGVYCGDECARKAAMKELATRKMRDTIFVDEMASELMRLWSLHQYQASKLPKGSLRNAHLALAGSCHNAADTLRLILERRSLIPIEEQPRKAA